MPIFCFNWTSNMGGADTEFVHLLLLLHRDYDITAVPNTREQFEQVKWRRWLAGLGAKAALLEDLPPKLSGWGLSLCNGKFWGEGLGIEAHRRGLCIIWSMRNDVASPWEKKMSKAARDFAVHELCNAAKHRAVWREVFEG